MSLRSQAIILAGGRGTRMGEETLTIPKPMIKIGQMPILWHIMKNLHEQGIEEFIILAGYKGEIIREFFRNYSEYRDEFTFYGRKSYSYHQKPLEQWSITIIDTGLNTPTAGRILKAKNFILGPVILTYGDGLANINVAKLAEFAEGDKSLMTVTAVHPPGRFGGLTIQDDYVTDFREKALDTSWINGGFFYMKPDALEYLKDNEMLEQGSIQKIIEDRKLKAYKHAGFWYPMDTQRDKDYLEMLWNTEQAPWKNWED